MESAPTGSKPTRVLVVSDRAAATPTLLGAIRERASAGPTQFRLLIPNPAPAEWHPLHPERHEQAAEAEAALDEARPAIEEAAGGPVLASVSIRHDPMDAVEQRLHDEPFDEIILAHTPHGLERWLHLDLGHRLAHLGIPVVTLKDEEPAPGGA
jgi:hypothetical protein